ncbi:hypothetical protein PanWU01x14_371460, partial [Parasponia andersonii]
MNRLSFVDSNAIEAEPWEFKYTLTQEDVTKKSIKIPAPVIAYTGFLSHISDKDVRNLHVEQGVYLLLFNFDNTHFFDTNLKLVSKDPFTLEIASWRDCISGEFEVTFIERYNLKEHAEIGFFWKDDCLYFRVLNP